MGLAVIDVRTSARSLLNEITPAFWTNTELDSFISDAAIDLSTKTGCYEVSTPVTLQTGVQTYTLPVDYVEILGVVYSHVALKKATPRMEGIQTAVATGVPKYFFDFARQLGLFPVPTATENATVITVLNSQTTSLITNIPVKFKIPATLMTMFLALLKEKQYAKASQIYTLYSQSLSLDKVEVEDESTTNPPPQTQYTLKLIGPNQ
jgi:hypothetical protein